MILFALSSNPSTESFVGKSLEVRFMLVGFIPGLHVLIKDVPGVGKTTMGRAMVVRVDVDFARIQFHSRPAFQAISPK